jgi:SAM-dependent methyltransferase
VLDLGSGDGKVLRAASRRGAKAVGYELHPLLVGITKLLSRGDKNVAVHWGNFWNVPFPDNTTVVYMFGDGRDIERFTKKIEAEASRLHRQLHVISYGFVLPRHTCIKQLGAHNLYAVRPLHSKKP